MPGGTTRSTLVVPPRAPYVVSGEGCRVVDADDHQVIDCNNNYTSLIHGHCYRPVVEAATAAISLGSAFGLPTRSEIDLAGMLAARVESMPQWRFVNSGTEAVMLALRIARAASGRDLIVRFAGSYHGSADAVVDAGTAGIPQSITASVVVLPTGDAEAFEQLIAARGADIAGVLIDLMPNRAGLLPADPSFVELVRQRTQECGAMLIVDEIISFRLRVGGLHADFGIRPDLITVGKVIGGGFPVGAVGGSSEAMQIVDPSLADGLKWGGTFNANPVTMAAGLAALEGFDESQTDRLNGLGDSLRATIASSGTRVAGSGSLIRIFPEDITATWWAAYKAGVLLGTNGLMSLSTAMTEADVEEIGERILSALE